MILFLKRNKITLLQNILYIDEWAFCDLCQAFVKKIITSLAKMDKRRIDGAYFEAHTNIAIPITTWTSIFEC